MEYHRKRRGGNQPRYGAAYPAYIAVLIVFFGIVYLISASKAGTWVAENWIAPVLKRSDAEPDKTAASEQSAAPVTVVIDEISREIVLPAKSFYALQIGVYADQGNASAQSDALTAIGAAGYILQDGDRYRVLASAYPDRESAQKVTSQLLGEGVESRVHTISRTEKVLKITGTSEQIETVFRAVERVDTLQSALYDAVVAFDKEKQSVADGIAALRQIERQTEQTYQAVSELSIERGALAGIDSFYTGALERLDTVIAMEGASAPEFSSALKALYIRSLLSIP